MKRLLTFLLVLCLLLSGCSPFGDRLSEPVTFYYVRNEYQYDSGTESVIAGEQRESSGHRESLNYLIAMYFLGPVTEELRSPLPVGTSLYSVKEEDGTILLELSETTLSDIDFSLACACLTMTCMEITDAKSVRITSGSRIVTMTKDNLTLYDSHTMAAMEETQ